MIKRIFNLIILTTISLNIIAQAPIFDSYKVLKNISSVKVNAITQCANGFIWLGTNNGLVRYDGVEFVQFAVDNGLISSPISCLTFNTDDLTLWIGHKNGEITYLEDGAFKKFDPEEGLAVNEISSIYFDNNNNMWFTTLDEGFYYYNGKLRKRLYNRNTDDGLLDNYVYSMAQIDDSIYYFATDKGISVYNSIKKTFVNEITTKDGLPDNLVKKIDLSYPNIWIAMNDGGVCQYNLNTKTFSKISEWNYSSITDMVVYNDNEVWVATKKQGIVRIKYNEIDKNSCLNYNKLNGLIDVRINSIFKDRENNIWVGSKKGLSLRKHNNIELYNKNSGLEITHIFDITIDNNNNFWLATQNGLFTFSQNSSGELNQQKVLDKPELSSAIYISIYHDVENYIWIGSYGYGVIKLNPKTLEFKRITTEQGIAGNDIFNITGDSSNVWLSTAGGGVSQISLSNNEDIKNYTINDGLSSNYVYSTFIENANKVWLATDGGGIAQIINNTTLKYSNAFIDSISTKAYCITPDMLGNLWINMPEKGLVKLSKEGEIDHITEMDGLNSNNIQSIICDNENRIIAVSDQGINIINAKSLQIIKYGEESGVGNLIPNLNAIYKHKGDVYIGTSSGIIKLNNDIQDTLIKPLVQITSKKLFLNDITDNVSVFSHKENNISFSYAALWFKNSGSLLYRHKLEGYDVDWSAETSIRAITYPKLPFGKYKFSVQVKLADGNWYGTQNSVFSFRIRPPFWKTTWFIIFSIIVGGFAIYSFVVYRVRRLQRDKEILEAEVVKRTSEIHKQKEEIEAQRDEIEAQRNHVVEQRDKIEDINNSLNSSITYASRIQKAVLPPHDNFKELLSDYFIYFKPRDIVSGDFYWMTQKGNKLIIAAVDCTGHGVPGAFMSMLGVSFLNAIVNKEKEDAPNIILNKLRTIVKSTLSQSGATQTAKDGMDMALCVIDYDTMTMQYSGAYNPLYIVQNNEFIQIKADRMPIGSHIVEKDTFTNHILDIKKGDVFYIFSDGYPDQFGGAKGKKFSTKAFRELLLQINDKPLNEQYKLLDDTFKNWRGNTNQIDDVLVIGCRI